PVKAMVDKKRGVKAKCANALKASEVMAQRRAAEAEAKAQAVAAEAEAQSQAEAEAQAEAKAQAEAEAQAEAQADAGAYEAEAQLHQLQTDLKHREQQLADKERLQQLQQQLQDLQRSELQRKEQQLAVLVVKQQAAVRQWEQQLTGQQQQLQQQLREQQQQLDQQQADLHLRELQHQVQQQLHMLQQVIQQLQEAADQQAVSTNHPLPDHPPCSCARTPALHRLDEHQAAAAAIAAAAVAAVLSAAVEAAGAGAAGSGARNTPLPVWELRSLQQQQQQQPQPLSISPQAWQRRLQPLLDEFQQYPVEESAELLGKLQQHRRMRSVVSLATGLVPPTPDQVLGGIIVESLRPVLASTKSAPGGQCTTQQQPFNTALAMTMGRGIEQHGIKRTAWQLGITPHAVKRARRSHLSNLAAGEAADWAAAPLRHYRQAL
ncbi:hypothetical protein QJQ45_018436, partial [Haematococcus lacustris]